MHFTFCPTVGKQWRKVATEGQAFASQKHPCHRNARILCAACTQLFGRYLFLITFCLPTLRNIITAASEEWAEKALFVRAGNAIELRNGGNKCEFNMQRNRMKPAQDCSKDISRRLPGKTIAP